MTINPFGRVKVGSCGKPSHRDVDPRARRPDGIGERSSAVTSSCPRLQEPQRDPDILLPGGWLNGRPGVSSTTRATGSSGTLQERHHRPFRQNIYRGDEQKILQEPYFQDVVVFEDKGQLLAKAYLTPRPRRRVRRTTLNDAKARKLTEDILKQARQRLNVQLQPLADRQDPRESRALGRPTNKVKHYLYLTREISAGRPPCPSKTLPPARGGGNAPGRLYAAMGLSIADVAIPAITTCSANWPAKRMHLQADRADAGHLHESKDMSWNPRIGRFITESRRRLTDRRHFAEKARS